MILRKDGHTAYASVEVARILISEGWLVVSSANNTICPAIKASKWC